MAELGLRDTHGILAQPWVRQERTSAGLGWEHLYLSAQRELPYREAFDGARSHLVILHLDGPVTVSRGRRGLTSARRIPPGGLFLHPADTELAVELGDRLDTVHVYLADEFLQAAGGDRPVRLAEEFGVTDQLLEQLVRALEGVVRERDPGARTYADQLGMMIAGQLARHHSAGRAAPAPASAPAPVAGRPRGGGLTERQFRAVRELLDARLAEPLPLAELAAAANLSVSQFARGFKARTGLPPHRYLMRLRVERACRLLRTTTVPISEVAVRCGFSHQEHLTRVLRAQLNTTPGVLRRAG
ncbi:AraC family transcriptional regulator [Streptomyces sp. Ru73]|uniref:helix-turn-helix domain-containing protein n=1 Tax=Streptomyces sp. Ru73 TaxID=2080748 RepID=UPI000CDDC4DD|nr:helix-turn-helix transcriptional regulator [Streptomyces sp. Ru73]POX35893.1 AraC family transcriptional regulator [Streptomyces sp. Ru73]